MSAATGGPGAALSIAYPESDEQQHQALVLALSHMPLLKPISQLQAMQRLTAARLRPLSPAGVGALELRVPKPGAEPPRGCP